MIQTQGDDNDTRSKSISRQTTTNTICSRLTITRSTLSPISTYNQRYNTCQKFIHTVQIAINASHAMVNELGQKLSRWTERDIYEMRRTWFMVMGVVIQTSCWPWTTTLLDLEAKLLLHTCRVFFPFKLKRKFFSNLAIADCKPHARSVLLTRSLEKASWDGKSTLYGPWLYIQVEPRYQ